MQELGLTLATAVNTPRPIPAPIPGATKKANPLPNVPKSPPPSTAITAPAAAYLAYRKRRRTAYLSTYLADQPFCRSSYPHVIPTLSHDGHIRDR